ncbi:MAG: hypothetical protein ABSB49_11200 [Polyangia bacterium]
MTGQARPIHLLPTLHLVAMLALALSWGLFFWQQSPSVETLRRPLPADARGTRRPRPESINLRKLSIAVRSGTADAALGLSLLLLFRLASGVQVKRLDNWLHARSSGDAAVFRGQNLAAANIAADRTSR